MSDEDRQPYLDQSAADAERFHAESQAADVAALALVEARRQAAVTIGEARGARATADQDRERREERRLKKQLASANDDSEEAQRRRQVAAQKKAEVQERRDKRDEEERALAKKHKKLDKDEARKASARLDYLLQQSSIFEKLQGGKGKLPGADDKDDDKVKKDDKKVATGRPGVHHIHDSPGEEEPDEEEEETDRHVFLTKQPSIIKFGQLKPYQLESLNWMIHLAEKGLNGILADGM